MDLLTAVILLALHLLTQGGLVAIVSRHHGGHHGMRDFALGLSLFGIAYLARLQMGLATSTVWALLPDAAMVLAALLFLRGQRQFMHAGFGSPALPFVLAGVFIALHAPLTLLLGTVARHASLNAALALVYGALAFSAWQGQRRLPAIERMPLCVLAVVGLLLCVSTGLRAPDALIRGVPTLFAGPTAQAYYALSSICALLLGPLVLWWTFARLNAQLNELATQDALTGTLNRNGLVQALQRHFAARQPVPLTWLMLDLDHFKQVNDSLGHATGDRLLQALGRLLLAQVRGVDFVARLGGEEFAIAAALTPAQAEQLAERLRSEVAALRLELPGRPALQVTTSIGVSPPFERLEDWETALRAADDALYAAKAAGRNRVALAGAGTPAFSTSR